MEAPPVINPMRRRPAWWLAVVLPVAAVAAVLYLFDPSLYGFYPRCMLYRFTGWYCPGCGSQRALYQLAHGHLLTALHDNAPLILSLPFFAYFALRWIGCWLAGAPSPRCTLSAGWIKPLVIALLVFTILRNIRCAPFTWLAPF